MQTQGYTTFHIDVPNDRVDYLELLKTITKNLQSLAKNNAKEKMSFEEFKSFAGSLSGEFTDISVNEMRENKALRK